MNLLTNENSLLLWRETVKDAEKKCAITLKQELETYLITLLDQYIDKPEIAKTVLATALLQASQSTKQRSNSLRQVGDECLIFAGLFPNLAQHKLVKISYFVNIGRSAYSLISNQRNDIFGSLAYDFVRLMDVLQCIRPDTALLPLEAYELWQEVGSQHALQILNSYTRFQM